MVMLQLIILDLTVQDKNRIYINLNKNTITMHINNSNKYNNFIKKNLKFRFTNAYDYSFCLKIKTKDERD